MRWEEEPEDSGQPDDTADTAAPDSGIPDSGTPDTDSGGDEVPAPEGCGCGASSLGAGMLPALLAAGAVLRRGRRTVGGPMAPRRRASS